MKAYFKELEAKLEQFSNLDNQKNYVVKFNNEGKSFVLTFSKGFAKKIIDGLTLIYCQAKIDDKTFDKCRLNLIDNKIKYGNFYHRNISLKLSYNDYTKYSYRVTGMIDLSNALVYNDFEFFEKD